MKLLILLLITSLSYGQNRVYTVTTLSDSLVGMIKDSGWTTMTLGRYKFGGDGNVLVEYNAVQKTMHELRKLDTVLEFHQWADTSSDNFHIQDTIIYLHDYCVKWGYFYSVKELHNTREGYSFCGNCEYFDYWKHLYFLDKRKKPLPKNIVVWIFN